MRFRFLCMLLLLFGASIRANATITQVFGGPGGSAFTIECPEGEAVTGFHVSAGAWVDALAPLCVSPTGEREQVGWVGGQGGAPQEVYCPNGKYIRTIYMTFTRGNDLPRQYLNSLGMTCGAGETDADLLCILTDDDLNQGPYPARPSCYVRSGAPKIPVPDEPIMADRLDCPEGEVLTGITGRYGNYVDALGAICGPAPKAVLFIPVQKLPSPADKSGASKVSTNILIPTQKLPPAAPKMTDKVIASSAVLSPMAPASPAPIAGIPPMDEALPVPIDGSYDTTFGKLTLSGSSGDYSYSDGKVAVSRMQGNWLEGTWEQSKSSRQCDDGRYYGKFRFEFTKAGFTGIYGYCGEDPAPGNVWNGSRM